MSLLEKGGGVPEELPVPALDPLVGMARVRQENTLLLRSELVQFVPDRRVHVMIIARQRLAELLEVPRRLDFGPPSRAAHAKNLEAGLLGQPLVHGPDGPEQIEVGLVL